jgi:pSer/pThr/pTyr-binding forkhead associated (FHA) protein
MVLPQGDEANSLMSPQKRWVLVSPDGRTFSLGRDRVTIGRAPENDLVVNEPLLSRQHAVIDFDGQHYLITDLDSTYGTTLNGQRLDSRQPYRLRPGDLFTLASHTTFVVRDSEPSRPLPADRDRLPPAGSRPSQE